MKNRDFLQGTQPIAFQTLANGFKTDRTSHAYLLSGAVGTPLKEMAFFLAQSFICTNPDPLACQECINCMRIEDNAYPDFFFVDGSTQSIKKQAIEDIQNAFAMQSFEDNGKKIYIIHLIEQATPGAINSLLKFIEEPLEDVIAIFTTQNISKILQTIISRCQVIRLKDYNPLVLQEMLAKQGHPIEDCYILSMMFTNLADIEDYLIKNDFQQIKDLAFETLDEWGKGHNVIYFIQANVIKKISDKDKIRKYLDIIEYVLKDVISYQNHQPIQFSDHSELIKSLSLIEAKNALQQVLLARGKVESNVNISLLLDSLFYRLLGGPNNARI